MDVELNAWSWLVRVFWALGILVLVAVAVWTLVRAPGRKQDPGLHPGEDGEDRDRKPGE